jgi:hypothetical protein
MNPTQGTLSEAWDLYRRHAGHFLSLSFPVYLGTALISALFVAVAGGVGSVISSIISFVALFWLTGAIVVAVHDVRDGRADLGFDQTFRRVAPVLGSVIIVGLLAGLGITVGLFLLLVPGLILLTLWAVVIPVTVLETGDQPFRSFGRSMELVRGHGWSVFGILVLLFLLLIAFGIVLSLILVPFSGAIRIGISNVVSGTLTAPFIGLTFTTLYFRLLSAHGGAGPGGPPAQTA